MSRLTILPLAFLSLFACDGSSPAADASTSDGYTPPTDASPPPPRDGSPSTDGGGPPRDAARPIDARTFDERCALPGVVRCYGFEEDAHVEERLFAPSDGSPIRGFVDRDVVASGAGSLRFDVPGNTPADTSGSMWLNFADDMSVQFGEGEQLFVQFRERFSPDMLRDFQGANGWKQMIVGEGDQPGMGTVYSCTELELVFQQDARYMGPSFYHSCGRFVSLDYWPDGADQVLMQHQGPPFCYYPDDPDDGCFSYVADTWMTFQLQVEIGTWNTESSRIRVLAAREGEPSVQIYDSDNSHPGGFVLYNNPGSGSGTLPGARYGKLWLLPYNTNKDPSEAHPTAYVWYDDLIISREPLPDP